MKYLIGIVVWIACMGYSNAQMEVLKPLTYADSSRISNDLKFLTHTQKARYYRYPEILNEVSEYIFNEWQKTCDTVYYQTYMARGVVYRNVIGSIGTDKRERIIIGAHYDVAGDIEGADDNASGIAGILELARLLSNENLNYRIDFVAYTLEEPPYFASGLMGSMIHAQYIHDNSVSVKGMICLDGIGYFRDQPKSQDYPMGMFKLFYGTVGDFIAIVQSFGNGSFGGQFKRLMKRQRLIETKSFRGPAKLSGVVLSDSRSYRKFKYPTVLITNTAFYRNPNYHESTDRLETLDLLKMSLVIDELYQSLKGMK
jgi:hypothetical protein